LIRSSGNLVPLVKWLNAGVVARTRQVGGSKVGGRVGDVYVAHPRRDFRTGRLQQPRPEVATGAWGEWHIPPSFLPGLQVMLKQTWY
jgi:hypothetical protein